MWTEGRMKAGTGEEGVPIVRAREGSRAFLEYGGWESLMARIWPAQCGNRLSRTVTQDRLSADTRSW